MKELIVLFLIISLHACAQKKEPILGETAWQREMNANFKDATQSPLKDKDREIFRGLDFFKYDSKFPFSANSSIRYKLSLSSK